MQKRFIIPEVGAHLHQLMIRQRSMLPASANNWASRTASGHTTAPINHTIGLHPVARKLLFISHPTQLTEFDACFAVNMVDTVAY